MTAAAAATADHPPPPHLFRALRSRNYRLFFVGQTISLVGTFLSQIAIAWLVYRLTGDALMLGTVAFAGQVPLFFLAPVAGVWVDRWDKRRLLVITQALSSVQSFALGVLALWHPVVWGLVALAFVQGLINCFDMPGRQAFLVEMIHDRDDLPNAIALNSTMVHAARLFGPAVGGFLVYWLKEGPCFIIDGVSYLAVIGSLLMMRVTHVRPTTPPRSIRHELHEGLTYVWRFVPVRALMIFMAILSLTGMPALNVLMPIFADYLGGHGRGTPEAGSRTLGFLMAASGAGALTGAIYLAARRSVVGLGRVIAIAGLLFGGALLAFAASRHLWLSLLIVPFAGFGMLANFASANTLLQTLAEDRMRGRVMSLFTVAFLGMAPFGNLFAGFLASHLGGGITGASRAILICGVLVLISAGVFSLMLPRLRKLVRPAYVQKGIIREVAEGLQSAATATESGSE
jgi:MFS family permease